MRVANENAPEACCAQCGRFLWGRWDGLCEPCEADALAADVVGEVANER